jgi:hypothetical protein
MVLLAFVFAAAWFVTGSMAAHLPRVLERAGATPLQAIAAAALIGPAQVAARVAEFVILRRIHSGRRPADGCRSIGRKEPTRG